MGKDKGYQPLVEAAFNQIDYFVKAQDDTIDKMKNELCKTCSLLLRTAIELENILVKTENREKYPDAVEILKELRAAGF